MEALGHDIVADVLKWSDACTRTKKHPSLGIIGTMQTGKGVSCQYSTA